MADRCLQGDVLVGKNIRMAGGEKQIDLRRPGADAVDSCQPRYGVFGVEIA